MSINDVLHTARSISQLGNVFVVLSLENVNFIVSTD